MAASNGEARTDLIARCAVDAGEHAALAANDARPGRLEAVGLEQQLGSGEIRGGVCGAGPLAEDVELSTGREQVSYPVDVLGRVAQPEEADVHRENLGEAAGGEV